MRAAANNKRERNGGLECLNGHGPMTQMDVVENIKFRGVELSIETNIFKCLTCGLKAGTEDQVGNTQLRIADEYRKRKGLLTSEEIRSCRNSLGKSQAQLAKKIGIGVASIKRWETGAIQNPSMDNLLRTVLRCEIKPNNPYNGNRELSLPRIKLVFKEFEKRMGRKLLIEGDKMLYAAKYIFYADMLAYRELGRSMTGATYAHLPHGPQLNNYRELIDSIQNADENQAEPLTQEELTIVFRVVDKFPKEWDAFNASHRESVVAEKPIGSLITYIDANCLKEI